MVYTAQDTAGTGDSEAVVTIFQQHAAAGQHLFRKNAGTGQTAAGAGSKPAEKV